MLPYTITVTRGYITFGTTMSNWNLVWLHPKRGPPFNPPFALPSIRPQEKKEQEKQTGRDSPQDNSVTSDAQRRLEQLTRQTKSSLAKRESIWMKRMHIPQYMEQNKYNWSKMELKEDCEKCIWTSLGTQKKTSQT